MKIGGRHHPAPRMSSAALQILRYEDIEPGRNPTGESLLSKTEQPYKIWIPDSNWLVLGNSQDSEKELNVAEVLRDDIPVYKRRSGGGAVLLSPGCLCIGLRFSKHKAFQLHDYFNFGSGHIRNIVEKALGIVLEPKGISDLVFEDRKVVGCALYMPRDFVLYLASILIAPNFIEIDKYLAHPSKEPEYRSGRSHSDFLVGLAALAKMPSTVQLLSTQFMDSTPVQMDSLLNW